MKKFVPLFSLVFAASLLSEAVLAQSVTSVRAIRSQNIIGPEDVEVSDDAVTGGITDISEVIGKEARVTLYPGRPILIGQVGEPALVERNALVRMTFREGPLNISVDGRVLDRGGAGERVRVMNLASRQIVSGEVNESGEIEVVK